MAAYPNRYGEGAAALEHWATACRASAAVLRREGHEAEARDLEDAARAARSHPHPGAIEDREPGHGARWTR